MKQEPLKGKKKTFDFLLGRMAGLEPPILRDIYFEKDIESAVAWLKNKLKKIRNDVNFSRFDSEETIQLAESWINEAFEDVK